MRICPLCDQEANSPHHIKPRSEGGTDEPRNIVYLCRSCHDQVEGVEFTPELVTRMRRESLGKDVQGEEYWWLHRSDGLMFIGVKKPRSSELIHFYIFIPFDSQMPLGIAPGAPDCLKEAVAALNATPHTYKKEKPKTQLSGRQKRAKWSGGRSCRKSNKTLPSRRRGRPKGVKTTTPKHKLGRPRIQLSEEQMTVLLSGGESVREKALRLGISKDITWRRLKEAQA